MEDTSKEGCAAITVCGSIAIVGGGFDPI